MLIIIQIVTTVNVALGMRLPLLWMPTRNRRYWPRGATQAARYTTSLLAGRQYTMLKQVLNFNRTFFLLYFQGIEPSHSERKFRFERVLRVEARIDRVVHSKFRYSKLEL